MLQLNEEIGNGYFMHPVVFLNDSIWILITISLQFVLNGPLNTMLALAQIMLLAPNRRQAIIWTDDDLGYDAYMHLSASVDKWLLIHWTEINMNNTNNFDVTILNLLSSLNYQNGWSVLIEQKN